MSVICSQQLPAPSLLANHAVLMRQTKVSPRQIQFVVFLLERTIDLMPQGVENLCLCIDFNASNGGGQPTTVGQARTVLHSE